MQRGFRQGQEIMVASLELQWVGKAFVSEWFKEVYNKLALAAVAQASRWKALSWQNAVLTLMANYCLWWLKTVVQRQIISDSVTVFKVPLSMAFCTEQGHV